MATGFFDGVASGKVKGWAKAPGDKSAIAVSLVIDGQAVETKIANLPRPDLSGLIGSTDHGFTFDIPKPYHDGEVHTVGVEAYGSKIALQLTEDADNTFRLGVGAKEKEVFRHSVKALLSASTKLKGKGRSTGPIALYACYNPTGALTWSQRRMLEELANAGCRTIMCNSTVEGMESLAVEAMAYCSDLLFRNNFGRDFASWNILMAEHEEDVRSSNYVVFVNDSFLGPFGSMEPFFDSYTKNPVDFFSITESWDVEHHFQSSIFILSKTAIASKAFNEFVYGYEFPEDKFKVIASGEIRLSSILLSSSLSSRVIAPYSDISGVWLSEMSNMLEANLKLPEHHMLHGVAAPGLSFERPHRGFVDHAQTWTLNMGSNLRDMRPINPQHVFWKELMRDYRIPLIKKELIFSNPAGVPDIWTVPAVVTELYGQEAWQGLCDDARRSKSQIPPAPYVATPILATEGAPRMRQAPGSQKGLSGKAGRNSNGHGQVASGARE